MKKETIAFLKKFNQLTKKSSIRVEKLCMVEKNTLYITNFSNTVIITDCKLEEGVYNIADLAVGKELILTKEDKAELPNYLDKWNNSVKETITFKTLNDFGSFAKFTSKDIGVLQSIYTTEEGKIATDSHIAKYTTKYLDDKHLLVSTEAAELLAILQDTEILIEGFKYHHIEADKTSFFKVESGNITVYSECTEGSYPNFPAVIPKKLKGCFTLDKEHTNMFKSLKKFKYLSYFKRITGDYAATTVDGVIADKMQGPGVKPINCNTDMAFNLDYLLKLLNDTGTDRTLVNYVNDKLPFVFNDSFLLMPIRGTKLQLNDNNILNMR